MRLLSTLIIFLAITLPSFSQSDTTFLYFNKNWKDCYKDTAFYYGIIYQNEGLWHRKDFWVKGDQIQMHSIYKDKDRTVAQGPSTWYYENGIAKRTELFENGKIIKLEGYYETGKKRAIITYGANGIDTETGWEENGNEIPDYVFEREAIFPGGLEGWKIFLEKNLDASVADRSNAESGIYPVKVQFIVDKEGNISNVNAIEVPPTCKRCGIEAVRVIKKGPKWEPAIQYGRKVTYQAIQTIFFQVAN